MAKQIIRGRFLKVYYENFRKNVVSNVTKIFLTSGERLLTSYFAGRNSVYCLKVKESCYRIVFGGAFLRNLLDIPDSAIPWEFAKSKLPDTDKAFRALYYHELGHLCYTDLNMDRIVAYAVDERPALMNLFNLLEDIVVEKFCMSKDHPYTAKFFKWMTNKLFTEAHMSQYADDGTAVQFFNYLLFRMRKGVEFKGTSALFDAHEATMLGHIKDILAERDATIRIDKTIVFFEYLKSVGLDMTTQTESSAFGGALPEASKGLTPKESKASASGAEKVSRKAASRSESGPSEDATPTSTPSGGHNPDTDEEEKLPGKSEKSESEGTDDDEDVDEDIEDPDKDTPINEDDLCESCHSTLGDGKPHVFYDMSHFDPDRQVEAAIDALLNFVNPVATEIATKIKTYQSRRRPRYVPGKNRGKLHVPSVIAGKPINIFKKKEAIGLLPDLAISVMCDNSGSMHGTKSEITTRAMLALAAASVKCGVPIEISAFTEDGDEHSTYRIKTFEDSFEHSKKYFGITSTSLRYHYSTSCTTFMGNKDENNIYALWQDLRKRHWRDKVLIVISDGQTCGSTRDLNELIKKISAEGIHVIGIGACDNHVKLIYEDCKVFSSLEDLDNLPAYLGDVLLRLIKGGK